MASKKRDYDVGYGKPPTASRFKKGQSGNPKGKRKGARQLDFIELLKRSMDKKVRVRVGDDLIYLSKLEAGAEQIANKIASGDIRTIRMIMPLLDKIDSLNKVVNDRDTAGEVSDAKRRLAEILGLDPADYEK
jgi:hypothetical protein